MKKFVVEVDEDDNGIFVDYGEFDDGEKATEYAKEKYFDMDLPVRVVQVFL